jgi:outer membrane lipoprotein-sorting protein
MPGRLMVLLFALRAGAVAVLDIRVCSSTKACVPAHAVLLILLLLSCIGRLQPASAQQPGMSVPAANAPLSTAQVVENLVEMNRERAKALRTYQGTRIYRVEYRGFPGSRSAEMIVNVKYQSPGTKEFTIQSATGSTIIIDKVFKKLLEAEKEALATEVQKRTALNGDNYDFTLVGRESTPLGSMYVLIVEPKTKDKFLYRGRIWVDAEDFAVVRLEAEPAKNPSFWTKSNEVEQVYVKVNNFWLPSHNHSVTTIRLGGRAELTIQYNNYQITGADPVGNLRRPEPTRTADISRAQR